MTTLSGKKPSFTVAGNENSITQAQQYSGICLRNKLTVINNQNYIVAQKVTVLIVALPTYRPGSPQYPKLRLAVLQL